MNWRVIQDNPRGLRELGAKHEIADCDLQAIFVIALIEPLAAQFEPRLSAYLSRAFVPEGPSFCRDSWNNQAAIMLMAAHLPGQGQELMRHGAGAQRRRAMPGQESLLFILGVGLAAGWLAAKFVQGHGLGLVGDTVVGIAGSYLGHELLPRAGVRLEAGSVQALSPPLLARRSCFSSCG